MYTYFIWCDPVTFGDPFDDFDVFAGSFSFVGACFDYSLSVLLWDVLLLCLWSFCFPVFPMTNKPQ